jgi:hypothetical protein
MEKGNETSEANPSVTSGKEAKILIGEETLAILKRVR